MEMIGAPNTRMQPTIKSGYSPASSICCKASWPMTVRSFGQHMAEHRGQAVLLGPAGRGGGFHRFGDGDAE
jgi:hypothetical protein